MHTPDFDDNAALPPPPRKGDRLFRGDLPDGMNNACLNVRHDGDPIAYTEGYRRGARLLVEHVMEHQRNQDYLVYPIIFLYRHHIELALKNLILHTPYLIDRPLTESEKLHLGRHRLDLLWQDLKPMLSAIGEAIGWGELDAADVEGIDNYIHQLTELDPDSFSFRYTRSKKGTPSLPAELKHINLRHFAEMMERLADFLDGLNTGLSVLKDGKAEMEAEWRNEMSQYMDYA
jgi:hypothetical protein